MPSSAVFYPSQTYWQTAREIEGSGAKAFPIPGDESHFVLERRYCQRKENYSRQSFDTADSVETSAYLVDEQVVRTTPAFVYFVRRYATIPSQHIEPGSSTYNFPGYGQTTPAQGSSKTITAYTAPDFTSSAHGFSDGDLVYISVTFTKGGLAFFINGIRTIDNKTTNTFETKPRADITGGTFGSGKVYSITPARNPITRATEAQTVYDYFLPGVSSGITDLGDIPRINEFSITDGSGTVTDTLSSTTTPTLADYIASVDDGEFLPTECIVERYMGNIFRRVTRYIKAG